MEHLNGAKVIRGATVHDSATCWWCLNKKRPDGAESSMSLILNILAISPKLLWRDYKYCGNFGEAFWFHASGAHRRICGYTAL